MASQASDPYYTVNKDVYNPTNYPITQLAPSEACNSETLTMDWEDSVTAQPSGEFTPLPDSLAYEKTDISVDEDAFMLCNLAEGCSTFDISFVKLETTLLIEITTFAN